MKKIKFFQENKVILIFVSIIILIILLIIFRAPLLFLYYHPAVSTINICPDVEIDGKDFCTRPKVYLVDEKQCEKIGGRWDSWQGAWDHGVACFAK